MAESVSISALLRKTEHYDKDERFMATSDLCEVLKRQQQQNDMDTNTEKQICTAVLRLLHDKSNDVQAVAVKTLGVLLVTVQQDQVVEIADSLADQVLDASKSELRDVYSIGLRTLIKTIPFSMGNRVAQRLVGRLLDGIRGSMDDEIVLACLDALTDLLQRFGGSAVSVTRQHEPILQMCLKQLGSDNPVVRKRAGHTIGCLSVVLSDALLQRMTEALLSQIDMAEGVGKQGRRKTRSAHKEKSAATLTVGSGDTRALIRTMCTVSGFVGHRLGQAQIDRILPIFLRFTDPEDAITGDDDQNDDQDMDDDDGDEAEESESAGALANELRESCFMGFESFVLRCPGEVEPHLEKIIQAALAYMNYDPNYSYGIDEDVDVASSDDDQEFDEEEEDYEDSDDEEDDDDDESWKVRRSAIRALKAVVEAKKHNPVTLWKHEYAVRRGKSMAVAAALVGRFKEREENCRVGILDCFTRLLTVTIQAAHSGCLSLSSPDEMDTSSGEAIDLHNEYAAKLVRACEKILSVKKGNERSKSSTLALLATLSQAPGGVGGEAQIASVFNHVRTFLAAGGDTALHREGTSKALRLDALSLVHVMLSSDKHDPVHVRKCLRGSFLPQLCLAVKEQWYKVIAEALRSLADVPRFFVVGYMPSDSDALKIEEGTEVANGLFDSIEPLLGAHDVDQEIKECALQACAMLLSYLHSRLSAEKKERLLNLLLDRLRNETTRIPAIKTLAFIASSNLDSGKVDLSRILAESVQTLSSFLKLQSRSLKQISLESLGTIITHHGANPDFEDGERYSYLVTDIAPLIVDRDLHLSYLSLSAIVSVLDVCPNAGPAVKARTLEPALVLTTSSLLQDLALDSLLLYFRQLVVCGVVEFQELLFLLRKQLSDKVSKTGIHNLAKCIATMTATSPDNCKIVLDECLALFDGVVTPKESELAKRLQLSLLVTGDLGRSIDMSTVNGVAERLKAAYVGYFDSSSEELKSAAAYALGNASVGSQATFLPAIVSKLDEDNKKLQFLLLSALREFIQCSSKKKNGDSIASSLPVIVPPLVKHFSDEEEGVRTMVAECVGSLTALQPSLILEKLTELQNASSAIDAPNGTLADDDLTSKKNALVSWTVATSVKLAITSKVDPSQLSVYMPQFVKLLEQKELGVRNAALLMVYSAVHHMPQVVSNLLKDAVMPSLLEVADLKLERKVDLGPFTHKVDDALPLRKTALSILATSLDNVPGAVDINLFLPVLTKALSDAEDIQLHAYQIIIAMCGRHPAYLESSIDSFVEPLEKTLNKKPGQKAGTELERLNDWMKSALRVTLALSKLEGATSSRAFGEFLGRVKANSKLSGMLESLGEES